MATCSVKHNKLRGVTIGCGYSRDLLDEKSKSPLFPGTGVVVTNNWCIIV